MNFLNAQDEDPYHVFNIFSSSAVDTVGSFIESVQCPPDSVYYAAEYIRLSDKIDELKEKVKNLEMQLKEKESECEQIKLESLKENELILQKKFNEEKKKITSFYETRINVLQQKNGDLRKKADLDSKNADFMSTQLKLANLKIKKKTGENTKLKADLQAKRNEIKKLKNSENKLQKKVNDLLAERLVQDCSQLYDNSSVTNIPQTSGNYEQLTEETNNIYQPISSPVTPVAVEDQERISVITHTNATTINNASQPTSFKPSSSSSSKVGQQYLEIFASISHRPNLGIHNCACGKKFDTLSKLRFHQCKIKTGKVYRCKICMNSFSVHLNLKNHYKSLHGIEYQYGKYGCGYCGQTFSTAKLLRRHRSSEH